MNTNRKNIFIITGDKNIGKTSFCQAIVKVLRPEKKITGIISPGQYIDEKKNGILAVDISSQKQILLAKYAPGWDKNNLQREWQFNHDAMVWGNQVLEKSTPTEILVVDEIGFLELEQNLGWTAIFPAMESKNFLNAIIVVRPCLLSIALDKWLVNEIIEISSTSKLDILKCNLIDQLFTSK